MNAVTQLRQKTESKLLRDVVLPLGDRLYGQDMIARLKQLEKMQWWTREQITQEREQRLRSLIKTAYNEVPFYRDLMDKAGVTPEQIRTVEDLRQLPVVSKDTFRATTLSTVRDTGQKTYDACSSGSTGKPFCVKEDMDTAGAYRSIFLLALSWTGWTIGEPHLQTGMTLARSRGRWLKDKLLHTHYISAYTLTDEQLDANLKVLEDHSIHYLLGYPGSLYYMAKRAKALGWNIPLKAAVTWGDTLLDHHRATIEQVFGCRVYDQYGCGEGIQISAQCSEGHYHVHELNTIVEYVDEANQPVPSNQTGNLLLTRLHPGPMPLIRYKLGDVGIRGDQTTCACGRQLERMESIRGREFDYIVTPAGNRMLVQTFAGIVEYFLTVDSFQVVQTEPGSAVLRLVPAAGYTDDVADEIVSILRQRGADDLRFDVELVDEIPLTPAGKHRYVISTLSRDTVPVR